MAFANNTRTASGGLSLDLSAAIYALMNRVADYRAYHQTVASLSKLNSRELNDLGLDRASIHAAAHRAVFGQSA